MKVNLIVPTVLLTALVVYFVPPAQEVLVLDRDATLAGEWWRLVTCHLVHFSASHLIYNLTVFGVVGWIAQLRGYRDFGPHCGLAAFVIGSTVLIGQPQLSRFGGLSGVATAALVFVSLRGLRERNPWRWVCRMAIVAILVKTVWECATNNNLFASFPDATFVGVPFAHLAGVVVALAMVRWTRRQPQPTSSKCVIEKSCEMLRTRVDENPCH